MMELTGGQENITKFKDLVAENVQNGYNLEFCHNVEKTACFDYMEKNFVSFHMEEEALMNYEKSLMVVLLHHQLI